MENKYQKKFGKIKRYLNEIDKIDHKITELKMWRDNRRKKIDEIMTGILKELKEDKEL